MRKPSDGSLIGPVSLGGLSAAIIVTALAFSGVLTSISVSENKGAEFCADAGVLVVETMSGSCPLALIPVIAELGRWLIVVGPVASAPLILVLAVRVAARLLRRCAGPAFCSCWWL